jgi:hypothetical protein
VVRRGMVSSMSLWGMSTLVFGASATVAVLSNAGANAHLRNRGYIGWWGLLVWVALWVASVALFPALVLSLLGKGPAWAQGLAWLLLASSIVAGWVLRGRLGWGHRGGAAPTRRGERPRSLAVR